MFNSMPTDNLYKFGCVLALALITASITVGPYMLKTTAETLKIASELRSATVIGSVDPSGAKTRLNLLDSLRTEATYASLRQKADEQIQMIGNMQSWGLWSGVALAALSVGFWYYKTQRFSDRKSSLAGTTPAILDDKHGLAKELGPILGDIVNSLGDDRLGDYRFLPVAKKLIEHVDSLKTYRDRYGSVLPEKALKILEDTIRTGRTLQLGKPYVESMFDESDSDYDGPDPTDDEIQEGRYVQAQNDALQLENFLITNVKESHVLKAVHRLHNMIENDVRKYLP